MFNRVTVGFDGSAASNVAVDWAATEASTRRAALRIVSCFEVPVLAWDPGMTVAETSRLRTAAADALAAAKERVAHQFPDLAVGVDLVPGAARDALVREGEWADLIVVGTTGHERAVPWLVGSTTRYVSRHCPCPVAVIPAVAAAAAKPSRVVVGVEGTQRSDAVVLWAADEADRHRAELVVVHGWSYPYRSPRAGSNLAKELTHIDAACALERSVDLARERCGSNVEEVLAENDPCMALLDTAREGDVIVVGAGRRGPITSAVFGSDTDAIIEHSPVPILILRGVES